MRFTREDFREVPLVAGKLYCPGCNASWDDFTVPSVGCPCEEHGTGHGSLDADGVESYLREAAR